VKFNNLQSYYRKKWIKFSTKEKRRILSDHINYAYRNSPLGIACELNRKYPTFEQFTELELDEEFSRVLMISETLTKLHTAQDYEMSVHFKLMFASVGTQ